MNIVHLCLANNLNAGDIALRYAAQQELQNLWPDAKILPADIAGVLWNKESIDFLNKTADLIVVGPGGIFLKPAMKETRSDWLWDVDVDLLKQIEKPLFLYSVGFNVFRSQKPSDKFIKTMSSLVEKTDYFTVRHIGGQKAIQGYLPDDLKDKIDFLFCPTLTYRKGSELNKKSGKFVGILCAGDRLELRHKNMQVYIQQMKTLCVDLKSRGYVIKYISHMPSDEWFLNHYRAFDEVISLSDTHVEDIYDCYDSLDYVVADRGHAQMIGFAMGAMVISPASHDKLNWFYQDLGLENFCLEECDLELSSKILSLIENTDINCWRETQVRLMQKISQQHCGKLLELKNKIDQRSGFEQNG